MNRSLSVLISILNKAHSCRVVYCKVRKTKYMLQFLNILREHNLIYGYSGESLSLEDKIVVYFRFYKFRPILHGIKAVSKSGHRRYVSVDRFGYLAQKSDPGHVFVTSSAAVGSMCSLHGLESISKINFKHKCGELLATVW